VDVARAFLTHSTIIYHIVQILHNILEKIAARPWAIIKELKWVMLIAYN
jgi:hypothetical protein